jgi:hypothetical protein
MPRIALLAVVVVLCAFSTAARAGCVDFRETPTGEALLVNHCDVEVNVGYLVGAEGGPLDQSGHLYRSSLAAESSKVLWSRGSAPIPGRYQIKVFSCSAPTDLFFSPGSTPACLVGVASSEG